MVLLIPLFFTSLILKEFFSDALQKLCYDKLKEDFPDEEVSEKKESQFKETVVSFFFVFLSLLFFFLGGGGGVKVF